MNKFRSKLVEWKSKLQDRKMYSVVIIIIGLVAIWGFYQYREASQYRQLMENTYNRAFYDMLGYVDNVETLLTKSLASSSNQRTASILQEAWRQSNLAEENLSQLPIEQPALASTSKFLTQVGDYANVINKNAIYDEKITDKQYKTLSQLHDFAVGLSDGLNKLQEQVATGRLKWGWLQNNGTIAFANADKDAAMKEIESIDQTFQKYPALIYDGPFSDHMQNSKPKALGSKMFNEPEAKAVAEKFISPNVLESLTLSSQDNTGNDLDVFNFTVAYKDKQGSGTIEVTKKGGRVVNYLRDREQNAPTIDSKQAIKLASDFLKQQGDKNMKDTYFMIQGSTITINFAYYQDKTIIYSDLMKVSISLDNGEIIGFEAKGFLFNHMNRKISAPTFTPQKVRSLINKRVKISSIRQAIIPTVFGTETYCQEIQGSLNGEKILIYFNCQNGREEDILLLLESDQGTMTM